MIKLLVNNKFFTIPYSIFIIICLPVLFVFSKTEIHLYVNQFHSPITDDIFRTITFMGSGWFIAIAALLCLLISFRISFIIAICGLINGIFIQFLKRVVFPGYDRPSGFLKDYEQLYLIPEMKLHAHFSFPSGHTAIAFCLFFCISIFFKNKWIQFLSFVFALIIGFSRVYLSQHFFIDMYFGSIISILLTSGVFLLLDKKTTNPSWQRSLLKRNS